MSTYLLYIFLILANITIQENQMYYLILGGSQQGPYTVEQVQAKLASGEITSDTQAWTQGLENWQPVSRVLPIPIASHMVPPVVTPAPAKKSELFSFLGGCGTTLAVIGAILLVLLVAAGGLIGYVAYVGNGFDKSSKAYVDEAVPAIVTDWSQDELVQRESRAFKEATTDEQLGKLFTMFRRLGALKSYDGCKGSSNMNYTTQNGRMITATYKARATFENGEAEISITLIREDQAWKIQGFRVNSSAFMK